MKSESSAIKENMFCVLSLIYLFTVKSNKEYQFRQIGQVYETNFGIE